MMYELAKTCPHCGGGETEIVFTAKQVVCEHCRGTGALPAGVFRHIVVASNIYLLLRPAAALQVVGQDQGLMIPLWAFLFGMLGVALIARDLAELRIRKIPGEHT